MAVSDIGPGVVVGSREARIASAARGVSAFTQKGLVALLQRSLGQFLSNPYLSALLVGSVLLSVASFFTTFAGMLNFMPIWAIAFCIVFAIQALLFVTAWRIGGAVAGSEPTPWLTLFIFAVCFATSVFFSWVALFETINDEDQQTRTRETRIHRAVEDAGLELRDRASDRRRDLVEGLLASAPYQDWRARVDAVAGGALAAREAIADQALARTRADAAELAALKAEKAELMRQKAGASAALSAAEGMLQRRADQRTALLDKVAALRSDLDVKREAVVRQEGLMRAEETGGSGERAAGRGKVWRDLRDMRNVLAAEADTAGRLLVQAEGDLAAADQTIAALRAEIAAGPDAGVGASIAAIDHEIGLMSAALSNATSDTGVASLDGLVAGLRADLSTFATSLDLAKLDAASARCDDLLNALRVSPAGAAGLSCDRAPLAEHLNPIAEASAALAALEAQCVAGGASAPAVTEMGFGQAVDHGRACIALSGLPTAEVRDLRGEIDRLVLEEDPNASRFVKTMNAFNSGDKLSYVALAIAGAIDALVLFSGLIGAASGVVPIKSARTPRSRADQRLQESLERALAVDTLSGANDNVVVRNARKSLRAAELLPDIGRRTVVGGVEVEAFIDLDDLKDADDKAAVKQSLRGLVAGGLIATSRRKTEARRYYLRRGALDALHQLIEDQADKPQKPPRPALPAPAASEVAVSARMIAEDSLAATAAAQPHAPAATVAGPDAEKTTDETADAAFYAAGDDAPDTGDDRPSASVHQLYAGPSDPAAAPERPHMHEALERKVAEANASPSPAKVVRGAAVLRAIEREEDLGQDEVQRFMKDYLKNIQSMTG